MSTFDINNLFTVIKDISETTVKELGYDQTIICKIIDDSNKNNGYYTVLNDSVSFDAYTNDTSYLKNEYVNVLIPKGDWSARKQIISSYRFESGTVNYVSKLDQSVIIEAFKLDKAVDQYYWLSENTTYRYSTDLCDLLFIKLKIE